MECNRHRARRRGGRAALWAAAAAAALAACVPVPQEARRTALVSDPTPQEEALRRHAAAHQQTVVQGVAAGMLIGGVAGRGLGGAVVAIPPGAMTGSYVSFLQRRYATEEERLAKLRADLDAANGELTAALATMQAVRQSQSRELAAARARPPGSPERPQVFADACANTDNMETLVRGAAERQAEFEEGGALVGGLEAAAPAQRRAMAGRILTMRQIVAAAEAESPTCA